MNYKNDNIKFIILQPSHGDRRLLPPNYPWGNDSFNNLSRLFQARLYHINDPGIEMDAKVYWLINFDIGLADKEIEFIKKVQANGAKVIIGFSQDLRFLLGVALMNENGTMYTDICAVADGITSGCSPDVRIYGRYQDKMIPMGEVLDDLDFSYEVENKDIDLLMSGPIGEQTLPFELEFALMVKEKYPEKHVMMNIPDIHFKIKEKIIPKYPQIDMPSSVKFPLIGCMKRTKIYCNPELRPRGGRALMEAYYCRVPFISSEQAYYSRLCPDFTYNKNDLVGMFEKYEMILNSDRNKIIRDMEERAQYDMFEPVYKRIKDKLGI
jgi:hypothetical protein